MFKAPAHRHALLALVVALCTVGCGPRAGVRMLTTYDYSAYPADYPVVVTEDDLDVPYTEVAEVWTRPFDDRALETAGTAELRDIARGLGGDAVVHVTRDIELYEKLGYRPGNLLRHGTRFEDGWVLRGVVVRLRKQP